MKEELISVIVPVYKVERYLKKCVDSIRQQTYKNLEIILIDDGSSDASGEMCDVFALEDKRIRVIHKKNGGLSDARNRGLEVAKGNYILFVDSDDYINRDMIQELYRVLIIEGCDLSLCNFLYVDEDGVELIDRNIDLPIKNEVIDGLEAIKRLSEEKGWYYTIACGKLYKKNLFDNVRFPIGKLHEDEFVSHIVFGNCNKIGCMREAYYYYVQRDRSIMHSVFSIREMDTVEAFINRAMYLKEMKEKTLAAHYCFLATMFFSENYHRVNLCDSKVRYRLNELCKLLRGNYWVLLSGVSLKKKMHIGLVMISPKLHRSLVQRLLR